MFKHRMVLKMSEIKACLLLVRKLNSRLDNLEKWLARKTEAVVSASKRLRASKSNLEVIGSYLTGRHPSYGIQLVVRCTDCGKANDYAPSYVGKYGCQCTRGAKISNTQGFSSSTVRQMLLGTHPDLKILTKKLSYTGKAWVVYPCCGYRAHSNIRNMIDGSGCARCMSKKLKQTMLERYGVESALQVPHIRKKMRRTMRERYGVNHALQNKDCFNKMVESSYSYHNYQLGKRTIKVQGYEDLALDYLQEQEGIKPTKIYCGIDDADRIPTVEYKWAGKTLIYHPDIFIPHLNRIVEVKSTYTYESKPGINKAKRKACLQAGYDFVFLVMDGDGTRNHDYD